MTTTYRIDTAEELVRHAKFIADSDFSEVEIIVRHDEAARPNAADGGSASRQAALDDIQPVRIPTVRGAPTNGENGDDADTGSDGRSFTDIADDVASESEPEPDDEWGGVKHKNEVPDGTCPICGEVFDNPRSVAPHTKHHTVEERAEAGYEGSRREMYQRERKERRELQAPALDSAQHLALSYLASAEQAGLTPISANDLQDRIDDTTGEYVRCSSSLSRLYTMRLVDREKRPVGYKGRKVLTYWPTAYGRAFIEDEGAADGAVPIGDD